MVGDVQRRDDVIETRHPFGEGGGGKGRGKRDFGISGRNKYEGEVDGFGVERRNRMCYDYFCHIK